MAMESDLLHVGWLTLSTSGDARRSTQTGSTLNGPNGSGQFYLVTTSTVNDFQVNLMATAAAALPSTLVQIVGVLQNSPGPGQAADIGWMGISKVIAGSTTILRGNLLAPSSSMAGALVLYQQGMGPPVGYALETPTALQQVFTAFINFPAHSMST